MVAGLLNDACILIISAVAARDDRKFLKIPNFWLYSWCAAGILYEILFYGIKGVLSGCIGFLIPLFILGIFFINRRLGAADVKLFCTLGIWLGGEDILWCLFFSFVGGAVISLIRIFIFKTPGKTKTGVAGFALIGVILKTAGVY